MWGTPAGSHDQAIDVLDTHAANKRVARCVGHSSAIKHLDWSQDGRTIRSTDQAYEVRPLLVCVDRVHALVMPASSRLRCSA
jgi:hypothetical protein